MHEFMRGMAPLSVAAVIAVAAGCGQRDLVVASGSPTSPGARTGGMSPQPTITAPRAKRSAYSFELQKSDWSDTDASSYNAQTELADGRRVAMFYAADKGLMEQHFDPTDGGWTRPVLLYRTKEHPCQGIELEAKAGTVAAVANWGTYCFDGEPPQESVAIVGASTLEKWDTHLTEGFDGWEKYSISSDGDVVMFVNEAWKKSLRWSRSKGFS
ncbi:hypothetical protein ACWDLG_06020 [Nonomuraea sp. NPDC003727]